LITDILAIMSKVEGDSHSNSSSSFHMIGEMEVKMYMLRHLGQRIRLLREQKGITLNEFAKELGVSPGYLSELERGKKERITFQVLDKLQEKLAILPIENIEDEESCRFTSLHRYYGELVETNPEAAAYLLSTFENGIQYFLKGK
jgi:transcriptional regulator with XRE-family HTH domain